MSIANRELCLHEEKKIVSCLSNGKNGRSICCAVYSDTNEYNSLLESMIQELLMKFQNIIADNSLTYESFKDIFEESVKNFNSSLIGLGGEIALSLRLHGAIQVFFEEQYIGVLIGDTSLTVVRNHTVIYTCANKDYNAESTSLFSQLIEGELQPDDDFILFGKDITGYYTESILNTFIQDNSDKEEPLIEAFRDFIVNKSLVGSNIGFIYSCIVGSRKLFRHCG